MKSKKTTRIISLLLCFCLLTGIVAVAKAENIGGDSQDIITDILEFKQTQSNTKNTQEFIDNELVTKAGTGAEWYVIGLCQNGSYNFSAYRVALENYVSNNEISSASSRLKLALCLMAVDGSEDMISELVEDSIGQQGIMSLVFGLHVINNGYVSESFTAETLRSDLLELQHEDGGWSITGQYGDVDVTSMTIQALAPFYSEEEIKNSIDRALVFLSERQLEDGDFASYGVANAESTAQVITALTSLNIDAFEDVRFIKNGNTLLDGILKYRLEDGSFSHTQDGKTNDTATVQVFCSLVAYVRFQEGKSGLYIFDLSSEDGITPGPTIKPDENEGDNNSTTIVEPSKQAEDKNQNSEEKMTVGAKIKLWITVVIIVLAVIICLVMYLKGKKNYKSYLAVLIVAMIIILPVLASDIKSADEYYGKKDETKTNVIGTVTITIRCDTISDKSNSEHIPGNGEILSVTEYEITEGESVYDVLIAVAKEHGISIDNTGSESMAYIAGIGQIGEFDFGDLSGWLYFVNNESPSVGCQDYELAPGDKIEWLYSCELGKDLE